jgi:exonuclease SbcC
MLDKDLKESRFDEAEFASIEKELGGLKNEKQDIQVKYESKDKELSLLMRRSGEIVRSEADLNDRISRKEKLLSSVKETSREQVEKEFQEYEKEKERLVQDIADKKSMISELEKAIVELEKEIGKCPVCDSELSEQKKEELKDKKSSLLRGNKLEIERLKVVQTENEKISKALKDKLRIIDEAYSRLKEFEGIEEKRDKIKLEKLEMDAKLDGLKKEKGEFSSSLNKIGEEYNAKTKQFERLRELKSKQEKYRSMKKELGELEIEFSKIKFNEKDWENARKELEDAAVAETRISGELNAKVQKEKFENEKMNDREKRLKEIEKYEAEIKGYEETIEKLQVFSNAIIETQQALREELVAAINEALGEVWGILYPYSDYPVVKLQPSESDFDLVFRIGDEWISVDGIASGGERALACLALKVSFAMVLTPNLSWLILDEPTHNLDEEAVRTLAVTLHDHIPKIVEQTFVVTHDENLRDAASGKLFRIERNKEVPEISNVEEITV